MTFGPDEHEPDAANLAARHAAAQRSTWLSVAVNLVLSVVQVAVGLATRSQSLVADGVHTLADLVSDAVVLVATRASRRDADADHPYGHHRFENAASLALGLLLLAVGLGMLWQAVTKLRDPASVPDVHAAALAVALGALVAKEALFRAMLATAKRVRSSLLVANAWHARSDAASSLVVAAGIAGNLAGYPLLDPIAAAIVGFMVGRMGFVFAWDALHDLMDRAVDDVELQAIRGTLLATPGVQGVHALRTRRMGDMIVADVHLEVDGTLSVAAGHDIALAARDQVLRRHRVLNLMTHVDPITPTSPASPATQPATQA